MFSITFDTCEFFATLALAMLGHHVGFDMTIQIMLPNKALGTVRASERPITQVCLDVRPYVVSSGELLSTILVGTSENFVLIGTFPIPVELTWR